MVKILVVSEKTESPIGSYESSIVPRAGDFIDANDGHWQVMKVQHDIRGAIRSEIAFQSLVVIYVSEEANETT